MSTESLASITPDKKTQGDVAAEEAPRFDGLDIVVKLLSPNAAMHNLPAATDALFKHLGVSSWEELIVFSAQDIENELSASQYTGPFASKLLQKRMGYIIEYAKHGTLDESTTMTHIVQVVQAAAHSAMDLGDANPSASIRSSTLDKKTVPTLDIFNGDDEDYFSYHDSTMNKLGQAGLARYLTDKEFAEENKEVAEAVFFSLRASIHGGNARSLATALYDKGIRDPFRLWSDMQAYYDTSINRANVVLFEVKKLLNLRLDPDVAPTSFIADFKECLLRLEKNKAKISEDTNTLCALLLVAIQDDQFETVRDSIVHELTRSVEDILKDIRERDTSMQMKDGARGLTGDGSFAAHRTAFERGGGNGHNVSWQKPLINKKGRGPGWKIPEFPKGWATAFGPKLFKILEGRCHRATWEQALAKELNYEFSLYTEYPSGTQDNKKKNNQKQKQSNQKRGRRTQSQQDGTSRDDDSSSQGAADAGSGKGSNGNKKKRIHLQHSGRVVTETNQ